MKGFEKSGRERRSRKELIQPIIDPSSESEPPGLNPSSEEEWPDPNYVDSDLEDDERVREGPGGDSLTESVTGSNEPKPLYKILEPSKIEKTAVDVLRHVRFAYGMCNEDNHHPPIGSVGRLFTSTDDGSCRGIIYNSNKP